MKTIALCSTARGAGKTTVGAFLCRQLGEVAAVKVMPRHRMLVGAELRPHGDEVEFEKDADENGEGDGAVGEGDDTAVEWSQHDATAEQPETEAETSEPVNYIVVDDPNQLLLRGSDTRRFWDAGAEPVIWVRARDEQVLDALAEVRAQIAEAEAEPSLLLVESNRYVREGGEADVTLLVYPNGSEELSEAGAALVPNADALIVTKRRPGPVKLALLDQEEFPAEKFDIPAFSFNLDEDSLALDDRFALIDWLRRRLDLNAVNADEACRAV